MQDYCKSQTNIKNRSQDTSVMQLERLISERKVDTQLIDNFLGRRKNQSIADVNELVKKRRRRIGAASLAAQELTSMRSSQSSSALLSPKLRETLHKNTMRSPRLILRAPKKNDPEIIGTLKPAPELVLLVQKKHDFLASHRKYKELILQNNEKLETIRLRAVQQQKKLHKSVRQLFVSNLSEDQITNEIKDNHPLFKGFRYSSTFYALQKQ